MRDPFQNNRWDFRYRNGGLRGNALPHAFFAKTDGQDGSHRKPRREVRRYILHDPILPGAPVIMPTPEQPSTSLRTAFLVVILLHLIAVLGICSFNKIKTRNLEPEPVAPPLLPQMEAAPTPTPPAAPSPTPPPPQPRSVEPANGEPLLVYSGIAKNSPGNLS